MSASEIYLTQISIKVWLMEVLQARSFIFNKKKLVLIFAYENKQDDFSWNNYNLIEIGALNSTTYEKCLVHLENCGNVTLEF